jgi:putative acetyltransferase
MIIRPEQPDDYAAIDTVNQAAFGRDNEARLIRTLRQEQAYDPNLSLVAVCNGQIAGHILFTPVHIDSQNAPVPAVALAPVAVLPALQGRGIGGALIREGIEACRRADHGIVIVLGHAKYYPRFGFGPASRYAIQCPFPVPDDVFMAQALTPGALDNAAGVVRYPAPFNDV